MKKILYTLSIVLAASTFCACDDSDEMGVLYNPTNTEAIFTSSSSDYLFAPTDTNVFHVTIQRANSKGNAEVAVEFIDTTGLFTIPSTVSFEDGSYETTLAVSFEKEQLETGTPYNIGLKLPDLPITGQQTSHKLTITRDYTWVFFTECNMVSELFGEVSATIEKAAENPSYIKIKDLYSEGHELKLMLAGDGSISMLQDTNEYGFYDIATGAEYGPYGEIYAYLNPDPNVTKYNAEQNSIELSMYYYVELGYIFGYFISDVITWE